MEESYRILYEGGSGEITEKKSRFIADITPVKTEEEALAFIEQVRKKYWDARHHCFAYRIGKDNRTLRASDDGEPSQTAGKPMMDVLEGAGLHDVCAVVTRYFGGTLLGTGGLVRAYSQAVNEGLKNCVTVEKQPGSRIEIETDYNGAGKIQYLAVQAGLTQLEVQYGAGVEFAYLVPVDKEEAFKSQVTEKTAGRAVIRQKARLYYGLAEGKLVIFSD